METCLRLLQIFEAESNRILIRQKRCAADNKSDEFWASHDFQPLPIIATSILVGSSFEPSKGYQCQVNLLAFNTTLDRLDNDDGIRLLTFLILIESDTRMLF